MKDLNVPHKKDIKTLMLAVAMTALVVTKAWAAEPVQLNTDIALAGDALTVGDVFTGVTTNAGHVLAPAPLPGKTLVLNNTDLKRISDAFNLGWSSDTPVQAVIHREGQLVDRYQVEALVAEKLKGELKNQKFEVALNDRGFSAPLSNEAASTLNVSELKYDVAKGSFKALVTAGDKMKPALKKEIAGSITSITQIPVLSRPMNSGDIITSEDIQYIDMKSSDVSSSLMVDAAKLIGQTPRRAVGAMKPVAASDIMLPPAVKKGEVVTMTLQSGKLQLTAQGRSLENGSVGDVVRIVNTSSQQVIQAVVTADRTVAVGAPDTALGNI